MLNDLIVIEKKIKGTNQNIFEDSIWEKEISCWACKESTKVNEYYSGEALKNQIETIYKVRNSPKVKSIDTKNYRLVHNGKVHDIKAIITDGKKEEFLKIECKMVS